MIELRLARRLIGSPAMRELPSYRGPGVTFLLAILGFFGPLRWGRADTLSFEYTAITVPLGSPAEVTGINDAGKVVGGFFLSGNHGFLYQSGVFSQIDVPGSTRTSLAGINNSGQIVGTFETSEPLSVHGFLDVNGVFTTIDVPGSVNTVALGINDAGQIVGFFEPAPFTQRGFLYSNGVFTTVDIPGATGEVVFGINNLGEMVGTYVDSSTQRHEFLYSNGVFTTLDFPGIFFDPRGINDAGEIVGIAGGNIRGVIVIQDVLTILDIPSAIGLNSDAIYAVNNSGQIVGEYSDRAGDHNFWLHRSQNPFRS